MVEDILVGAHFASAHELSRLNKSSRHAQDVESPDVSGTLMIRERVESPS